MNLLTIINAKLSDKSGLGEWYTDRLKACLGCEFNSENKKNKTLKEKAIVSANFGKPSCLACGCEIAAKASVEEENCGMVKLGKPSKWKSLNIGVDNEFRVSNLVPEKVIMSKIKDNLYQADYVIIKKGSDSLIKFEITKNKLDILKLSYGSACGCTTPQTKHEKGIISFGITYDTQRIGTFDKTAHITIFEKNGKSTKIFFNIKGEVKDEL